MQKGQLFSLDFIISMVAVTAAIALLIHGIEVNAYSQKEQELHNELKQVAEAAADLLVSNPDIVCELVENAGGEISSLNNCLPLIDQLRISKTNLGISGDFKCELTKVSGGQDLDSDSFDCKDDASTAENVASIERQVVVFDGGGQSYKITKAELEACLNKQPACELSEAKIRLKVWKP